MGSTVTTFEKRKVRSLASFADEKKEDKDNFQSVGDKGGASLLRSRRDAKNESSFRAISQNKRKRRGILRRAAQMLDYTKSASKLLVKALPTSTIFGRACLFLAVHICAICIFLMCFGKKTNSTLSTRVHSILNCDRSIRFCGMSERYGWTGFEDAEPIECTNPLPRNVLLFCDEKEEPCHCLSFFSTFYLVGKSNDGSFGSRDTKHREYELSMGHPSRA